LKELLVISSLLIFLSSCHKEDPAPTYDQNNSGVNGHYAYFKGIITDSITGIPITDYKLEVSGPNAARDTLIDGNYSLYAFWFEGKYSFPKPTHLNVFVLNSNDSIVKILHVDGNLLIEDETKIIDFQVNL
jgi:hypothetical protein